MRFQVLMIGDGFEEADDVLACRGIEALHGKVAAFIDKTKNGNGK